MAAVEAAVVAAVRVTAQDLSRCQKCACPRRIDHHLASELVAGTFHQGAPAPGVDWVHVDWSTGPVEGARPGEWVGDDTGQLVVVKSD